MHEKQWKAVQFVVACTLGLLLQCAIGCDSSRGRALSIATELSISEDLSHCEVKEISFAESGPLDTDGFEVFQVRCDAATIQGVIADINQLKSIGSEIDSDVTGLGVTIDKNAADAVRTVTTERGTGVQILVDESAGKIELCRWW